MARYWKLWRRLLVVAEAFERKYGWSNARLLVWDWDEWMDRQ